jgi:hypothetical protein
MDRMSQTLTVIRDRAGRVLGQIHATAVGWTVMTFRNGRTHVSVADSFEHAEAAIRAAQGEEK